MEKVIDGKATPPSSMKIDQRQASALSAEQRTKIATNREEALNRKRNKESEAGRSNAEPQAKARCVESDDTRDALLGSKMEDELDFLIAQGQNLERALVRQTVLTHRIQALLKGIREADTLETAWAHCQYIIHSGEDVDKARDSGEDADKAL